MGKLVFGLVRILPLCAPTLYSCQAFPAKAYAIENKWLIPSDFRKHKTNRINNICILCR